MNIFNFFKKEVAPIKLNSTAAVIFSFDRPHYLKLCLESIEKNTHLEKIDFYFVQDGPINKFSKRVASKNGPIKKCLDLWEKCSLPNKNLLKREWNLGVGINQFETREFIFDKMGYERCLFFEDDLVLGKDYFRVLLLMMDQFEGCPEVSAVMCHGHNPTAFLNREQKSQKLKQVLTGNYHLWGWGTWRNRWIQIKPFFLEYFEFIKDTDYKSRPTKKILNFYAQKNINIQASSQDSAMYYAIFSARMFVLNTFVSRSKYIGAKGVHMNPIRFKELGYERIILEEFIEDETLSAFESPDIKKCLLQMQATFKTHQ